MRKKYYGKVSAKGTGTVFEEWYDTRGKAVRDLKQKARETVLNSFEEDPDAGFSVSLGGRVITTGHIPKQRFYPRYAGTVPYGYDGRLRLPIKGTRIC